MNSDPPFDASLFVEIRKRLSQELMNEISQRILEIAGVKEISEAEPSNSDKAGGEHQNNNKGELLLDATVAPQDIAYPTDLNLLNRARHTTEKIIDTLHVVGEKKPRTYRQEARKAYLKVAQNRNPSKKTIRKAIGKQLSYLKRNFGYINKMLDTFEHFPLPYKAQRQLWVCTMLYEQQLEMYAERKHSVQDRIVSIHQPHVRPIVRGKARAKVEFGSKMHLSLVDGYAYLDTLSWDAYNEGTHMQEYVENYKQRFGYYPARVLADKIYATRHNRKWLKERNIKLAAKPLGRPSSAKAVAYHVRPGERNPIEGKFGQAKNGYGLNKVRARLKQTSQSWIASIILVLNLVRLTREAPLWLSFSAWKKLFLSVTCYFSMILDELRKLNTLHSSWRTGF